MKYAILKNALFIFVAERSFIKVDSGNQLTKDI
ncbi:hypothetical protein NSB1T_03240 [Coprobacter fastidiosus NSB1 = JCM 33896]|nr:hypothetical protein NSB1T_03240 [Coprobacter fastidiosus NSB1 = JCM 33896]